jgi:hypothetical protein
MMNFDEFQLCIKALQNAWEFQNEMIRLANAYDGDFGICSYPDCSSELLYLLVNVMDDKYEWIEYWCYELNFGKDYHDGTITDSNAKNIKLETVRDLYDFLVANYEN